MECIDDCENGAKPILAKGSTLIKTSHLESIRIFSNDNFDQFERLSEMACFHTKLLTFCVLIQTNLAFQLNRMPVPHRRFQYSCSNFQRSRLLTKKQTRTFYFEQSRFTLQCSGSMLPTQDEPPSDEKRLKHERERVVFCSAITYPPFLGHAIVSIGK